MKRRDRISLKFTNLSDEDEDNVPERASYCFAGPVVPACLVREVQQMPPVRQEEATKDVLGISEVNDIAPETIAQLWEHVHEIEEKPAWDLALQMDREYTMSPKRAMAFLRSVGGKPKQAAKRLVRHFETKLDLFGPDKLVKDIELASDFDEHDMEALESGGFQVLPERDRAGRPILFGRYTLMKYRQAKNMVRALWYMWNSMVEDEEHQKSGVVAIGFEVGKLPLERFENSEQDDANFDLNAKDGGFDRNLAREILKIPLSVPIRPMGYHICADSSQWQSIFDMVMVTLCKFVRVRLRFHYGTRQETAYAMMTHGIPVDALPIKDSGDVDLSNHRAWIQKRLEIEERRRFQSLKADTEMMM